MLFDEVSIFQKDIRMKKNTKKYKNRNKAKMRDQIENRALGVVNI